MMHPLLAEEMARLHAAELERTAARASVARLSGGRERARVMAAIAQLFAALKAWG